MQNKKSNIILTFIYIIIIVLGIFTAGFYVGAKDSPAIDRVYGLSNKESKVVTDADFDPFWKVWNTLNEKSITIKEKSDQDRVWGAIQGLALSTGDPYTVFFPPEENKLFKDSIHGSFGGIGAEIDKKEAILTVVAPLKGTPAEKAGILSGDKILRINKEDATNITIDKAISLIRGPIGTHVELTILHEGEKKTRDFNIIRENIEIPTIKTEKRGDVFLINFYTFSENSKNLFIEAMNEFTNSGLNKLIIDLRGNPGGYLDSAIDISSFFLDSGKVVVIQDFGDKKKSDSFRSRGQKLFDDKKSKLIILVDGGSASASEIMAGALREHGVAKLVGTKTFGKGSVQELVEITDDTSLKVTIARWLTPKGISISKEGLMPDYEVKITREDLEKKIDPQMEKALELLR